MPPVAVKRITQPRTIGLQYNGENFMEVVDFYLRDRYATVNFVTSSKRISLGWSNEDEDSEGYPITIEVGDWIINEDTEKFVVKSRDFSRKFAQEPPADHKLVDTTTGQEVAWDDVTY